MSSLYNNSLKKIKFRSFRQRIAEQMDTKTDRRPVLMEPWINCQLGSRGSMSPDNSKKDSRFSP